MGWRRNALSISITAKGLCGDGKAYGKVETFNRLGMTANQCVQGIIKGLVKKNKRIVIGKIKVFLLTINRFFPRLSKYIIKSHPMRKIRDIKAKWNSIFNIKMHPITAPHEAKRKSWFKAFDHHLKNSSHFCYLWFKAEIFVISFKKL